MNIVLVLPIGSADAERGFSVMNDIRNNRRLLSPENLNNLMRLRINGPKELDKFPAAKYAKEWVKGHLRTDDPAQVRKKPRTEEAADDGQESVIEIEDSVIVLTGDEEYLRESQLF
jgi:hypothetical protein